MFSKLSKLTAVRCHRQLLYRKNSMRSSLENHKKLQPKYNVPFSLDLTSELREENSQFMAVFPDIIRELTEFASKQYELGDAAQHFSKALEYNVPDGKKIRGLTAVIVYKNLIGKERQTTENIRQAQILGWCIELLQSVFLMSDDMIDCSLIRRNKPCWYKVDGVRSVAVNDLLMIENACYLILKRFFSHLPCYANMIHLFHSTAMNTFIGQSLDYQISNDGVTQFTMEKHICMSNYKTSHFAFYAPIALPMMLAGYYNRKMFDEMKHICCELGHFYQVQNDFLDCFSDTTNSALKKPGTDIEDGKCTWLAVKAMENGTGQHKAIMEACYGKDDPGCVNQVKQVYSDLELAQMYCHYEERIYESIKLQIEQFSNSHDFPQDILIKTLDRTFNRV